MDQCNAATDMAKQANSHSASVVGDVEGADEEGLVQQAETPTAKNQQPSHTPRKICRLFLRPGGCMFGDECNFIHDKDAVAPRKPPGHRRRHTGRDGCKPNLFRCWLVQIFGEEQLKGGLGVLDVAGGKAELAFQLENLNGVSSLVVDPRPLKLESFRRRLERGFYHRNKFITSRFVSKEPVPHTSSVAPMHLRTLFHATFARDLLELNDTDAQKTLDKYISQGESFEWGSRGLVHLEGPSEEESEGRVLKDLATVRDYFRGCSTVVGLHPDQAAGELVDFALAMKKPFACAPCCVFQKQFPRRRLKDGTRVRTFEQLVQFLQEKDCRIRKDVLPFDGKNIVLYMTPEDYNT